MILLLCSLLLSVQDVRKPDDNIQLKVGQFLIGKIQKVDNDHVEFLVSGDKESRRIPVDEIHPYSLYVAKLSKIDKSNGAARYELAEFCMKHAIYTMAVREFEEAAKLDKNLEEKATKRKTEAHVEDARAKFEEAKKLLAEKPPKYEEANRFLGMLIANYDDTPYYDEARKLIDKVKDEITKENEEKKAMLAAEKAKKDEAKAKTKEDQDKLALTRTADLIEEAQKAWVEALDQEPRNVTRAEKAWKGAEAALLQAKRNLETSLKSPDAEVVKKSKEMDRQVDAWLVKTYYRLGSMQAVEGNYAAGHEWLNRALKIPHDETMDRYINEMLLTLRQMEMRRRAARY